MNKNCLLTLLITIMSVADPQFQVSAQQVRLTITNPSAFQRHEVVELSLQSVCNRLGLDTGTPLVVRNTLGQEMTYQKSYDGKLLLYVAVHPQGKVEYTISQGETTPGPSFVFGKIYPERLDDLTWENDRAIFRFYGPALQRRGEKSFGTDIWVKNTPELVAEERYRLHMWGWAQGDSLKKAGKAKEGNDVISRTTFHLDHGKGMDCYAVGATLGCGAPALMKDGQLVFPYCYKECKILDNGPLRFTALLVYNTTAEGSTEHRLVSLDRGSHFNRMTVWYDGITLPTTFATGVVLHHREPSRMQLDIGKDYILYADPTENPDAHQSQIYVGTLFPNGIDEVSVLKDKQQHAIGTLRSYQGEPYTYYFGAAWSAYDVRTMAQWHLLADNYLHCFRHPLTVSMEKTE